MLPALGSGDPGQDGACPSRKPPIGTQIQLGMCTESPMRLSLFSCVPGLDYSYCNNYSYCNIYTIRYPARPG